jgi:hypothetical protein
MDDGWTPGEELVRRAVTAFVTDALAPASVRGVLREGISQLRELAAWLPSSWAFRASLWLDRADALAAGDWLPTEISIRLNRLAAPMLRAGLAGLVPRPAPSTALTRGHPPPGDPDLG